MAKFYPLKKAIRWSAQKIVPFKGKALILCLLCLLHFQKSNGDVCAANEDLPIMKEEINDENIHTVLFAKPGLSNAYPIMQLSSQDQLLLQFDVLGAGASKNYQFTIVHCDADWHKSNMLQSDYITGLYTDYASNFTFSSSTYVRYAHYIFSFPSSNMNVKISGNYILKIFTDDPEKPVITRRFYVYEQLVGVNGTVQRATYSKYRDTKQEINFTVNTTNLSIIDPFTEIKTVLKQNWRQDNEITDLKPTYIRNQQLIYDYQEGNLFDAGNEFRPFDIRDIRYKGIGVRNVTFDSIYHALLFPDEDHSYTAYSSVIDQNGNYTVTDASNGDASTTADYVKVNFKLSPTYLDDGKDIYVFGGLSNWKLEKRFKMQYSKRYGYECSALLKQGFYDYQYVKVNEGKIDPSEFEGNHWETENNYTVFVYYRSPGMYGDTLVGVLRLNTGVQK
jgi:hypothetical protein